MPTTKKTAKVTLVTLIVGYEMKERVWKDLSALGVRACTILQAEGHGLHGARKIGFLDNANLQIEMLVAPELGAKVLELIETSYAGEAVIAYAHEVQAVPLARFA